MEVFRFIAYRPPEPSRTPAVDTADAGSRFQEALLRDVNDARALDAVRRHAAEYLRTPDLIAHPRDLGIPLEAFGKELEARQVRDLNALHQTVRDVFKVETADLLASDAYRAARRKLGDSLIALAILGMERADPYPELARALRLCGLLERAASGDERLRAAGAIERALNATLVLPERIFPLPPAVHPEAARRERLERQQREERAREEERERLVTRFRNLQGALEELGSLPASAFRPPAAREVRYVERSEEGERRTSPPERETPAPEAAPPPWTLSIEAISTLSKKTLEELAHLKIRLDVTPLPQVVSRVEHTLGEVSRRLAPAPVATNVRRVGSRFFAGRVPGFPAGLSRYPTAPGNEPSRNPRY